MNTTLVILQMMNKLEPLFLNLTSRKKEKSKGVDETHLLLPIGWLWDTTQCDPNTFALM